MIPKGSEVDGEHADVSTHINESARFIMLLHDICQLLHQMFFPKRTSLQVTGNESVFLRGVCADGDPRGWRAWERDVVVDVVAAVAVAIV